MKKVVSIILILMLIIILTGCGDSKYINGIEYDTYGLLNKGDSRNPDIRYRMIVGNVIWSIILCESIVFPIYFVGFSLYEPVGIVTDSNVKGQIN